MLLIVGTVRLPPDRLEAARPAMAKMIAGSRAETGCIAYSYAEDLLEPGLIRVNELWRDGAALDAHFASAHIAEWRSTWPLLGITDRNLVRYEVDQAQPT
jgi:quinol monooxygenase YgiN